MYKTAKTFFKELNQFSTLRFECIRVAESLRQDMDVLQKDYDTFSSRLNKLTEDYSRILADSMPLIIGVAGNFNAGKSTFINSVVGSALLGVDEKPATCKVAVISYYEGQTPRICKICKDGKVMEATRQEYLEYGVHRKRSEADRESYNQISHFEIKYHADILREIQLVDTPGFSTVSPEDDRTAEEQLRKTDMLIWVFNGGIGSPDKSEIDRIKTMGIKNIIAVVNRIDDKPPWERDQVIGVFSEAYDFLRVIPYSATKALEYQQKVHGSDNREGPHEDPYFAYHLRLLAEIRSIRKEITTIKEDRLRQDLRSWHMQEVEHWTRYKAQLYRTLEDIEQDQDNFVKAINALNDALIKRSHIHFEDLKATLLKKIFDTVFYFEHERETSAFHEHNVLKRREIDPIKQKIQDIINQKFDSHRKKILADFNAGLQRMGIETIPDHDQETISLFQEKLSLASFEGIYGMMLIWQQVRFVDPILVAEEKALNWINMFVSSNHFADITLYYLHTIYNRILDQRTTEFNTRQAALKNLFFKIEQTLNAING